MTRRSVTTKRTIDAAFAAGFGFQADIVEAAGVPQNHEIAAQRLFVVDVARLGEDQRLQGVLGNAAGAAEFDGFDRPARRV